ncbi:hypothetical protein ElyMa_000558900 [Elysia marginata]|uniref:Uncharacterized protein n=1 Tax=Elysia marginata TaxID=1093978 RepID=A0AAV4G1Y9_9GAST|nr:hypothetical protein ElyMa_000558900 [Elysia marginata]
MGTTTTHDYCESWRSTDNDKSCPSELTRSETRDNGVPCVGIACLAEQQHSLLSLQRQSAKRVVPATEQAIPLHECPPPQVKTLSGVSKRGLAMMEDQSRNSELENFDVSGDSWSLSLC